MSSRKRSKNPDSSSSESIDSSSSDSSSPSSDEDSDVPVEEEKIAPSRLAVPTSFTTPPRQQQKQQYYRCGLSRGIPVSRTPAPPPAPRKRRRQPSEVFGESREADVTTAPSIYETSFSDVEDGGRASTARVRSIKKKTNLRGKTTYAAVTIPSRITKDAAKIDVIGRAADNYWERLEEKTTAIVAVRDRLLGGGAEESDKKRRKITSSPKSPARLLLNLPERRAAAMAAKCLQDREKIPPEDSSKSADVKRMIAVAGMFATCVFPTIFYHNEEARSEKFIMRPKDIEKRKEEELAMLAVAEAFVPLRKLVFARIAKRADWDYVYRQSRDLCYSGMLATCERFCPRGMAKITLRETPTSRGMLAKALAEERIGTADWILRHWEGPMSPERAGPYPIEYSLLLPCCKTGSRPGIEWMLRHDLLDRDTVVDSQCRALAVACHYGRRHPDFVRYMFEKFYPFAARLTTSNCEVVCAAFESGSREIVSYIFDAHKLTFGELTQKFRWAKECAFIAACSAANLELAEWVREHAHVDSSMLERCATSILVRACSEGRVDVLSWLRDKFRMTKKIARGTFSDTFAYNAAFLKACKKGQLDVVRWLVNELKFNKSDVTRYSLHAFRNACTCGEGGGLEIARFLAEKFEIASLLQKPDLRSIRRLLVDEARQATTSEFVGAPVYFFLRDELRISEENLRMY